MIHCLLDEANKHMSYIETRPFLSKAFAYISACNMYCIAKLAVTCLINAMPFFFRSL